MGGWAWRACSSNSDQRERKLRRFVTDDSISKTRFGVGELGEESCAMRSPKKPNDSDDILKRSFARDHTG